MTRPLEPTTEFSTPFQRSLLAKLRALVAERAGRETQLEADFERDRERILRDQSDECRQRQETFQNHFEHLNGVYLARLNQARVEFDAAKANLDSRWNEERRAIDERFRRATQDGEANWSGTRALALQNFETDEQHAKEAAVKSRSILDSCRQQFGWLQQHSETLLRRRGITVPPPKIPPVEPEISAVQLIQRYSQAAEEVGQRVREIASHWGTRFVDEGWPVLLFVLLSVLLGVPLGLRSQWTGWQWPSLTLAIASLVAIAARQGIEFYNRRALHALMAELCHRLDAARCALAHTEEMIPVEERRRARELEKRKNRELRQADEAWGTIRGQLLAERQEQLQACEQAHHQGVRQAQARWDAAVAGIRSEFEPELELRQADHDREVAALAVTHREQLAELDERRVAAWRELADQWHSGTSSVAQAVEQMRAFAQHRFPPWDKINANSPEQSANELPALPFGEYGVNLADLPNGLSKDARLKLPWQLLQLPAFLAFPQAPSLLIESEAEGRQEAIRVLQHCMFRLLTSLPPGKVRFTIFDPTGLGENFSAFMHLADFDERLVANRIWTEATHLQQRLADLTEHMENVIQKYLRNEFPSIQAYNDRAGEIAEPFQVLVIANFPANFTEESARRLVSIASSGARCGVYFLMSVDTRLKLPHNFDLRDLESAANTLVCRDGRWSWKAEDLSGFPLHVDAPPTAELGGTIVRMVGKRAKEANRVEVPFDSVTPPESQWWQGDSRQQIDVPLGRAGATQLQYLSLGTGTSQHVLVAGKTGSGKSTLLNAVITNLALHYGPAELQFFLVDFKKGVEFKAYAEHRLPHARVIAIESEREFGLSVLERLDQELQERGELYRSCGAQNLAAFRDARPDHPLPRLLLIVDEFQEFFVRDDKIAQEASLLLDRLVRQGRAFGVHVLLGSQTLAGAYTLARSTLGQMAVRIALQCSESDAHLILSEENTAARLLNRPGEAIYNNANGRFEGNHPFQVVWLPDSQRESYLRRLADFARSAPTPQPTPIVFEGNVPARIAENPEFLRLWTVPPAAGPKSEFRAWLGAAIAIKSPTHVNFRRQAGSHLLVVGQQEEMALGLVSSAVLGLAAGQPLGENHRPNGPRRGARFIVLDGGGFESLEANLATRLARINALQVDAAEPNGTESSMEAVAAEVAKRMREPQGSQDWQPIFLVIYNLARFRELRRTDDDFGMGSFSEGPATSPARQLTQILRDGPQVLVHVILWCDTYNNLTRWFDRATIRDLAYRVLFQMSATDSSNLIDSAAASQLGANRAILHDDERGESERFRPYGPPDISGQAMEPGQDLQR